MRNKIVMTCTYCDGEGIMPDVHGDTESCYACRGEGTWAAQDKYALTDAELLEDFDNLDA